MKETCRLEISEHAPSSSGRRSWWWRLGLALLVCSGIGSTLPARADCPPPPPEELACPPPNPMETPKPKVCFNMVSANPCLPDAKARVRIKPGGPVEMMDVDVAGLPP